MNLDSLKNPPLKYIGDPEALIHPQRTLLVVGPARGGTSMVAGTLYHLGVFSGTRSRPPIFEDIRLAGQMEHGDYAKAEEIIVEYNSHNVWAFKRPATIDYFHELHFRLRNPIYLFIFKDMFSISNRRAISQKADVLRSLKKVHDDHSRILDLLCRHETNAYLMSYEKIMADKSSFVDAMIELAGAEDVSDEQRQAALDFIEPNPQAYLLASRTTRTKGEVETVERTRVRGWARYVNDERTAIVQLFVNGSEVAQAQAKHFDKKLRDQNVHSTGRCAFKFNLARLPLKAGDEVAVKVSDDVVFLVNAPVTFEA